ncbi:uncharacterized protein BYT42DRAFT_501415 [Radiomyces spectabilis]|uniref:uncharacterized protein n=1 Tax=Radiomyces spectabilis TaxID=64574 RepID=UPI002220F615|nr:uncharacterized protein BYT42DRAFT_501415 [Radiomyces spectabilis]KAI8371496.1 hypothetical protein BYT42DRAFT_501415 [Radiomyces spectabilis]
MSTPPPPTAATPVLQPAIPPPSSSSSPSSSSPHYAGMMNGMANMSIHPSPTSAVRQDIPLIGQPPLLQDLYLPVPEPRLPNNVKKNIQVPVVADTVVSRCTRCKTYINPFVQFTEGALKWRCNMCGMDNDVPPEFDWDILSQQHADRWSRCELNYGCVDFTAPAEYIMRPPQPPIFVFVIDTSFQAIQSGMIDAVADAILASLDKIPNEDGRTKVAFITVDHAVSFYRLVEQEPEILVVGELADMYLPRASSDLVVNLAESRSIIEDLLTRMKTMFSQSNASSNCLGSALKAAQLLLSPVDTTIMTPSSSFYKTFAGECAKAQICADMFVFGGPVSDLPTLNVIPRFTGGQTHYYPAFNQANVSDVVKLKEEVKMLLGEHIGLEAVMRTRCSPGLICKAFYGNCTTRVPDIMALPNVPRHQSYCVDLAIEEDIQSSMAFFQTALLHTTCTGERRIRVMTLCLPVTKTIDKAAIYKLRDAREYLTRSVIDICSGYGKEIMGSGASGAARLTMCRELSLLPLLVLGILKTETFQDAPAIPLDVRAQSTILLRTLPNEAWLKFVHPNFYSLHNMPQQAGTVDSQTGKCMMPPRLNLSSEKLEAHGCYLVENGQTIFIWIGKDAVPALCMDLLGAPNIQEVKTGQIPQLPALKSSFSQRVTSIIDHLRKDRSSNYYPTLYIVREDGDPMLRSWFLARLLEDRQPTGPAIAGANQDHMSSGMSYFQWLGFLRAKYQ